MKITKTIVGHLEKCYALSLLEYQNKKHFLVAAEKVNNCEMYDLNGNKEDVIWNGPGGVMTIAQLPESNGVFLATQKFYSPNDSKEAGIIIAEPSSDGWKVRTLLDLPFVHRFDVVRSGGINYLIACTLKSGHKGKDDWTSPGKVFAMELPEDLSEYHAGNQLKPEIIMDSLTKNHGYTRFVRPDGTVDALVAAESGVFSFTPPESKNGKWKINQLLAAPASDAQLIDLDGSGEPQLCVISPFHGDTLRIYRKENNEYKIDYTCPQKLDFLHAICGCRIGGKPFLIVGNRRKARNLLALSWDEAVKGYSCEVLDRDCGPANVLHFCRDGKDYLVGANREIDEIALYRLEND